MNIALINTIFDDVKIAEPLGLCYLSAVLKKNNYNVDIIEPCIDGMDIEETVQEIEKKQYDFIGISVHRDKNVPKVIDFINLLKRKINNDSFISIGGHGPSVGIYANSELYLTLGNLIDCYMVGEGEITIVELIKNIQKGNWKESKSIVYVENGKFVINETHEKISDLDTIPFMDRTILKKLQNKYGNNIPASILLSRGCAYNKCNFCTVVAYEKIQNGKCYRQRSIKNIINEICYLHDRYGINEFNFEDDNFILPGKTGRLRVEEFCELVENLPFKINFSFFCRIDAIEKQLFLRLKNIGLCSIYLGIESINDSTLKFFKKNINSKQIMNAIDILLEIGFGFSINSKERVMVGYITWHPYTTIKELSDTLKFIQKYNLPVKLLRRRLRLYTGAEMNSILDDCNLLDESEKRGWKYFNPKMKILEEYSCRFIDDVNQTRDRIRSIEKAITRFSKFEYEVDNLLFFRETLDKMCLNYCLEMIKRCRNLDNNTEYVMRTLDNQKRNEFLLFCKEKNIDTYCSILISKLGLPNNTKDIFRK